MRLTKTLTDVSSEIWTDQYHLGPGQEIHLAGADSWSICKRTLRGGLSQGIDVVRIDNGVLAFEILPTRGMGIWRGSCQGVPLGWNSPSKFPVHPSFIDLNGNNGTGWLVGFNELLCRCGLDSVGRPERDTITGQSGACEEHVLTLHGTIANSPAHFVSISANDEGAGTLTAYGVIEQGRLFGTHWKLETSIETQCGTSSFTIQDRLTNLGGSPSECQLLYHTNLGEPILENGSTLIASFSHVAPYDREAASFVMNWNKFSEPASGFSERCFFLKLVGDSRDHCDVLLKNSLGDRGVCLSFSLKQLPYFTLWNHTAVEGDGYVVGLEPGTSFPNPRSFERRQGRTIELEPMESYSSALTITYVGNQRDVAAIEERIAIAQSDVNPVIHREIDPILSSHANDGGDAS